MVQGGVRLLLHESVLVEAGISGGAGWQLRAGAEALLRRLRWSDLQVVICYAESVSTEKEAFAKKTADLYSLSCVVLPTLNGNTSLDEPLLMCGTSGNLCLYATNTIDEALFFELHSHCWKVICIGTTYSSSAERDFVYVDNLLKLPITICRLTKEKAGDKSIFIVGYVMKASREEDFLKRRALPLCPTPNGLIFVPISFDLPLDFQLRAIDIVLHKVTDEIINVDLNNSYADFQSGISLSLGMSELQMTAEKYPDLCIIDPLKNMYPLLDRLQIQHIILGLHESNGNGTTNLRAPHFLKVDVFHDAHLQRNLMEADLHFPILVKPQVACGVSDAHNMALVFKYEDFANLSVPLPAVLQEYVDHNSKIYKFYNVGNKVFHAVRRSMPNADVLKATSENLGCGPITFNSLKNLPVDPDNQSDKKGNSQQVDIVLCTRAAKQLKRKLGLSIFGFDIVVQEGTGDHVMVDLNYLPSFKEVADAEAIPAFWDAIWSAYKSRNQNLET